MDSVNMDQALASLSPRKKSERMDSLKFELWNLKNQNRELAGEVQRLKDRVEGRLDSHAKLLAKVEDATKKLQESDRYRINQMIKMLETERDLDQRISKLEEGASGSGLGNNASTDIRRVKRPKRRCCCSFCGKELNAYYLKKHQRIHCKQASRPFPTMTTF